MKQEGHLQVFDLALETRSPVFIGCGKSYTKKEYLFDSKRNMVSFLDERAMFTYLAEHNLADAYERYILGSVGRNLQDFLLNICQIPKLQIRAWTRCQIYAGDALDDNHSLKEIQRFIRNGRNQVYMPGSSIKGALRTALLKAMLLRNPPRNPDTKLPFDRYSSFEDRYFHTLALRNEKNQAIPTGNPLNSLLRGVKVSDSLPIGDDKMCLTRKIDEFTDNTCNTINICRECLKPGTTIRAVLTLDQSILQGRITKDTIAQAIAEASAHYQEAVIRHYPQSANGMNSRTILLGGGVGFQSKTVTDPYYGGKAMEVTMDVLKKAFPKHHHERDNQDGISPRALKQTDFNNAAYSYGVCEVTIR